MAKKQHKDLTSVHPIHHFSFADAAAREAASVNPNDVGRVAFQQDDRSFWILTNAAPATWEKWGGGSGSEAAPAGMVDLQGQDLYIYVRPSGNDTTGDGTLEKPFATPPRALQAVPLDFKNGRVFVDVTGVDFTGIVSLPPCRSWSPDTLEKPAFNIVAQPRVVNELPMPEGGYSFVYDLDWTAAPLAKFIFSEAPVDGGDGGMFQDTVTKDFYPVTRSGWDYDTDAGYSVITSFPVGNPMQVVREGAVFRRPNGLSAADDAGPLIINDPLCYVGISGIRIVGGSSTSSKSVRIRNAGHVRFDGIWMSSGQMEMLGGNVEIHGACFDQEARIRYCGGAMKIRNIFQSPDTDNPLLFAQRGLGYDFRWGGTEGQVILQNFVINSIPHNSEELPGFNVFLANGQILASMISASIQNMTLVADSVEFGSYYSVIMEQARVQVKNCRAGISLLDMREDTAFFADFMDRMFIDDVNYPDPMWVGNYGNASVRLYGLEDHPVAEFSYGPWNNWYSTPRIGFMSIGGSIQFGGGIISA